MDSVIMQADQLNLPEQMALMLQGKKVEVMESEGSIIITPIDYKTALTVLRGKYKKCKFGTEALVEEKKIEKELEYGG